MNKFLLSCISFAAFFITFSYEKAEATHLMGGDLIYTHIKDSTYEVEFYVYRDCNPGTAPIDQNIVYEIFNASDSTLHQNISLPVNSIENITSDIPGCGTPSGVCVEMGTYIDTVNLGHDPVGHYIVWARNERNHSAIDNLFCNASCPNWMSSECSNPYGNIWLAFVPPHEYKNSSPRFLTEPVPHLCANQTNIFNHNASDPEGDSLGFSFITPKSPPGTCGGSAAPNVSLDQIEEVDFAAGYSATQPLGVNSNIEIDSNTGQITANPGQQGNFVLAIQVDEYRIDPVTGESTYMGSVIRDLQFLVGSCPGYTQPFFQDDPEGDSREVDPFDTLKFDITGLDTSGTAGTDSLFLSVNGTIFGDSSHDAKFPDASGMDTVTSTFEWVPDCEGVSGSSPHIITFNLASESCGATQTTYTINVPPRPVQSPPELHCLDFETDSSLKITWQDARSYDDFDHYTVYRRAPGEGEFSKITTLEDSTLNEFTDTSVSGLSEEPYQYFLKVANSCGQEGLSSDTLSTVWLDVDKTGPTELSLNWNEYRLNANNQFQILHHHENDTTVVDSTTGTQYVLASCDWEGKFQVMVDDGNCPVFTPISEHFHIGDTLPPGTPDFDKASFLDEDSLRLKFALFDIEDLDEVYIQIGDSGNLAHFDTLQDGFQESMKFDFYYGHNEQKCFNIAAIDTCGNLSEFSGTHCPVYASAQEGNLSATISWEHYSGLNVNQYILEEWDGNNWNIVDSTSAAQNEISQTELPCNVPRKYRVGAITGETSSPAYSNTVEVTPFDTIPPGEVSSRMSSVSHFDSIEISFDTLDNATVDQYKIEYSESGSGFDSLTTISSPFNGTVNFSHGGVSPESNRYCYRVSAIDSCSGIQSESFVTHCPVKLEGTEQNRQNTLNWHHYEGRSVDYYELQIEDNGTWQTLTQTSDSFYVHDELLCNTPYEYRIVTNFENINDQSLSNQKTLTPFDTVPPGEVSSRMASVTYADSIEISFNTLDNATVDQYKIEYSESGSGFDSLTTISSRFNGVVNYSHGGVSPESNRYCYRVSAIDSCSGVQSESFVTHCPVKLEGTEQNLQNTLNWHHYEGRSVDYYEVQVEDDGSWQTLTQTSDSFYVHDELLCNTPYEYRIVTNFENINDQSLSNQKTLTPFDTLPPGEVPTRMASVVHADSIEISFDTLDNATVDQYKIEYSESGSGFDSLTTISSPFNGTVNYSQGGVSPESNRYCYRVSAIDSCSGIQSESFVTHCPVKLEGTEQNRQNTLNWHHYEGRSVDYYELQIEDNGTWQTLTQTSDSFYVHDELLCNANYEYRVVTHFDNIQEQSLSNKKLLTPFDTVPPEPPEISFVTQQNENEILLNWYASESFQVTDYEIYRKPEGGNFTLIDTTQDTSYIDESSFSSGNWCYAVKAVDSCGPNTGEFSQTHCGINLQATTENCEQEIQLDWTAYQGWEQEPDSYEIYRQEDEEWNHFYSVTGSKTELNDSSAHFPGGYCYRIEAEKDGLTSVSNVSCDTTFETLSPEIKSASKISTGDNNGEVEINWQNPPHDHLSFYRLYFKEEGGNFNIIEDSIPLSDSSYLHQNLNTRNEVQNYYLTSVDSCGNKSFSGTEHTTINLNFEVGQLLHQLNWTPYQGFEPEHYLVQQKQDGEFVTVDSVPAEQTEYQSTPAPCNVPVFYRIKAISPQGYESLSDTSGETAIDSIPPDGIEWENISVNEQQEIELDYIGADSLDVFGYQINRNDTGKFYEAGFQFFDSPSASHSFTDSVPMELSQACYTIVTQDSCLNENISQQFCPVFLSGQEQNLQNSLYWEDFEGYEIEQYILQHKQNNQWEPLDTFPGESGSYIHEPLPCNVAETYRITGHEENGPRITHSNIIELTPFDTTSPPPPEIDRVSVLSDDSLILEWQLSEPKVKDYEIRISTDGGSWSVHDTIGDDTTHYLEGFDLQNTSYCFKMVAIDSCEANRSEPSVLHCPVLLEGEDQNLAAGLNWSAYEGFEPIHHYKVERKDDGAWKVIDSLSEDTEEYTDEPLACDIPQEYRIVTYDQNLELYSISNEVTVTPFDTVPPPVPVINAVSVNEQGEIEILWNPGENSDARYFEISKDEGKTGFNILDTVIYDTIYTDTAVKPDEYYYDYEIVAIDSCAQNNRSDASTPHRSILLEELSTGGCEPYLEMEWTAYQGFEEGIQHYEILRQENGGLWQKKDEVTELSYVDSAVQEGESYCYRIQAVENHTGIVASSSQLCKEPEVYPHPVNAEMDLVTVNEDHEVEINWSEYDGDDTFATGYRVYHAAGESNNFQEIAELSSLEDTSYTHQANVDEENFYKVRVFNVCDIESEPTLVHKPILLSAENKNLRVDLDWLAYEDHNAEEYRLIRQHTEEGESKIYTTVSDREYIDTTVRCDHEYTYHVEADLDNGATSISNRIKLTAFDTLPPETPEIVSVSVSKSGINDGEIVLQFNGATDKNRKGYEIYRAENGGNFQHLDEVYTNESEAITFYDDDLNTMENHYSYEIVSLDSCDNASEPALAHTSVNLSAEAENSFNDISWSHYAGFENFEYQLERKREHGEWQVISTILPTRNTYVDEEVRCDSLYLYRITVTNDNDTTTSLSNIDEALAYKDEDPIIPSVLKATVEQTGTADGVNYIEWEHWNEEEVYFYNIYRKDSANANRELVSEVHGTSAYDSLLNTAGQSYYYSLEAVDSCGNISEVSDAHKTIHLKVTSASKENMLNWEVYEGWEPEEYHIERNGEIIASVSSGVTEYVDEEVYCHEEYEYRIIAYNDEGLETRSNFDSGSPEGDVPPAAPEVFVSTVSQSGENIEVIWHHSSDFDVAEYQIERMEVGQPGGITEIANLPAGDSVFVNEGLNIQSPVCYRVSAINHCGEESNMSNRGCIIYLEGASGELENHLSWNEYLDWPEQVLQYRILKSEDGGPYTEIGSVPGDSLEYVDTSITDHISDHCYRVEAVSPRTPEKASLSTEVCLKQPAIFHIPNAFSPGVTPGVNDYFKPEGLFIESYEITIYNRWGQRIHESEKNEPWDGKNSNGEYVDTDVYLYQIRITGEDGESKLKQGTVHVVR